MAIEQKYPIVLLSFNRPDYLRPVLESLRKQRNADILQRPIALFQDGSVNPNSNLRYASDSDLQACVAAFKELMPHGSVFASEANLGIALNYDRAERYCFETLAADVAIFLEDDLVLSEHYIETLEWLITSNLEDPRVGYVAAYGDHTLAQEAQEANRDRLTTMHHNWAFALFRRQWHLMRPYVQQYLDLVRDKDYRLRDHAAVARLFASWGFGAPATSQDAAKTLACCLTRTIKVNTAACFGRYIGERGVHMTEADFRSRNYARTYVFPQPIREFERISQNRYHQIRADLVHWARRPDSEPADSTQSAVAREHFHATNAHIRDGRASEAERCACKGISALFAAAIPGFNVRAAFYPMTLVRDQANESHVRFDIRNSTLHVLCPTEMLGPHFTNYLHAFMLAAALLEKAAPLKPIRDTGFTMDLGSGADVGNYRRVAFSSSLASADLVIDPDFFVSEGFASLRDVFKASERPWKERANVAFWRGNSTGIKVNPPSTDAECADWRWLQRLHLCDVARKSPSADKLNVGLSQVVQVKPLHLLNAITSANFLLGPESERELTQYRHVFAIDGNTSVGNGLIQAMLAGACVILIDSPSGLRSWYYDRLSEGQTHVSVKADLADFDEKMAWVFSHPDECARIAANGHALATSMSYEAELQRSAETIAAIAAVPKCEAVSASACAHTTALR